MGSEMCIRDRAVRLIEAYAETLDTDTPLDKAYDHTFGEF